MQYTWNHHSTVDQLYLNVKNKAGTEVETADANSLSRPQWLTIGANEELDLSPDFRSRNWQI